MDRPDPRAELQTKDGLEWWEWEREDGVRQIHLTGKGCLTDADTDALAGEFLTESNYAVLLKDEDADVYRPEAVSALAMFDGGESEPVEERLLVSIRRGAFPKSLTRPAWEILRKAAHSSKNRGYAAGKATAEGLGKDPSRFISRGGATARYLTQDGMLSETSESNMVLSGIVGNFNSTPRNPYCRQTAFTRDNFDGFLTAMPLVEEANLAFKKLVPTRWENQHRFVQETGLVKKGWALGNTVFSTITVNKNYQTGTHKDAGDFLRGFGNLMVLEGPTHRYRGGHTVFPKFRVAVDLREGDFLGMDVHEWHGNTALSSAVEGEDDWERISVVCYVRVDMTKCGTQEEESQKQEVWQQRWRNPLEQHAFRLEEDRVHQEGLAYASSVLFNTEET